MTHAEAAQLARMWLWYPEQREQINALLEAYRNQFAPQDQATVRRWIDAIQLQEYDRKHGLETEFTDMVISDSPLCEQLHK